MNLKHAQYMLTVLQEGSITAAARKLYISQPSLSQMIKAVETDLGTPIFNRTTDPISLTYAGEKYMEAAQQILTIHANLDRQIEEICQEEQGKLRFGIPVQRGMQLLPPLLSRFYESYPHVDVEIFEVGSGMMENLLIDNTIDLACFTTTPRNDQLNYILAENEELVLLAAKDTNLAHRIPSGTPISITAAREERFVSNKPGHSIRSIQDNLFAMNNMQPKIILESVSIEVEKRVCLSCGAVMLCPKSYLDMTPDLMKKAAVYPVENAGSQRHCYVCHRTTLYLTKYMRDFIDLILNIYGSNRNLNETDIL